MKRYSNCYNYVESGKLYFYQTVLYINHLLIPKPFPIETRLLTTLRKKPFENIVGKGENAGNQHFLLFPQCFLTFPEQFSVFGHIHFVVCKCLEFGLV